MLSWYHLRWRGCLGLPELSCERQHWGRITDRDERQAADCWLVYISVIQLQGRGSRAAAMMKVVVGCQHWH